MITFQYPGYNPTTTITLPSPERGDDKTDLSEVFIHQTESGQYKSNVNQSCLGEYERPISITGMCQTQIDEFMQFVNDAMGHYIKYTDYNGDEWITQITNEVININEDSDGFSLDMVLLVWEL